MIATVEVEDEFAVGSALRPFDRLRAQGPSWFIVLENLHFEARRCSELLLREIASEVPRHPDRAAVLAAAMLQFLHHLFGRGIAQLLEH